MNYLSRSKSQYSTVLSSASSIIMTISSFSFEFTYWALDVLEFNVPATLEEFFFFLGLAAKLIYFYKLFCLYKLTLA